MSEDMPQAASGNMSTSLPEGGASQYMDRVMIELSGNSELSADQAADFAADSLVGVVLRTLGRKPGFDAIAHISRDVGSKEVKDAAGQTASWEEFITRGDGLRRAVVSAQSTPKPILSSLVLRLRTEDGGITPIMTTADQIKAYLDVKTEAEQKLDPSDAMRPWKDILKAGIDHYFDFPDSFATWRLIDNPAQGIDPVRDAQNEWQAAARIAGNAGVDVKLLTDSAEWMRANQSDPVQASAIRMQPLMELPPDYGF